MWTLNAIHNIKIHFYNWGWILQKQPNLQYFTTILLSFSFHFRHCETHVVYVSMEFCTYVCLKMYGGKYTFLLLCIFNYLHISFLGTWEILGVAQNKLYVCSRHKNMFSTTLRSFESCEVECVNRDIELLAFCALTSQHCVLRCVDKCSEYTTRLTVSSL
jgi:hypothetical protein